MAVYVHRRPSQWFAEYDDPAQAFPDNPAPAVLHASLWDDAGLYRDPNAHPTDDGTNAGENLRKFSALAIGRIVAMRDTKAPTQDAVIHDDASHTLALKCTGRDVQLRPL